MTATEPAAPRYTVLAEDEWRAREEGHVARMRAWTDPHRRRKSCGEKHPVLDFLFTYYSHRPARLQRWQPGPWTVLTGDASGRFLQRGGYREVAGGVALDLSRFTEGRAATARFILSLLTATASRAPQLNCFGLHEWAMVYRQPAEAIRHPDVPLRLGPDGTDAVVEEQDARCTHYDAYRFFSEQAKPRNATSPSRQDQPDFEQPGCLHTNMDLFKWAYKLDPFVPAELLADSFELAASIREVDMRASPYDLTGYGYTPIPIEKPHGRAEYARKQAEFTQRAAPIRERLIEHCRQLLAHIRLPETAEPGR